jgi:hypothetical protein
MANGQVKFHLVPPNPGMAPGDGLWPALLILPVRICVITELIALCAPTWVSRVCLTRRTASRRVLCRSWVNDEFMAAVRFRRHGNSGEPGELLERHKAVCAPKPLFRISV